MTSGHRRHDTEPMAERILMIDDDNRLAGMVQDDLGGAGFRVSVAGTGREGEALLKRETFDAVILDLMLPDADGLDLCRRLRASSDVPILMLTARGEPMDRVVGLELGADDYLAKPFEPRELLARIRAILRRRTDHSGAGAASAQALRFGFVLAPKFTLVAFAAFVDTLRLAADDGDRSRPIECSWTVVSHDMQLNAMR